MLERKARLRTLARIARAIATCAIVLAGAARTQPLRQDWPGASWPRLETSSPTHYRALVESGACRDDFIPFATGRGQGRDAFLTDGLVVARGGTILFEHYDAEYDAARPHVLWSASKSVTATLLGAAIQAGTRLPGGAPLTLDTPLQSVFPASLRRVTGPDTHAAHYRQIRLRHLLGMTAGFAWRETYEADITHSSFLPMLYLEGQRNMSRYAMDQPMLAEPPGTRWTYSGGNSNIIMAVLRAAAGPRYATLPWDLLFGPLGMEVDPARGVGPVWERDGSGHFVGSSYLNLAPRDMARIGLLYLRDGIWQGRRILPEGWIAQARRFNTAQGNVALGPEYVRMINDEGIFSDGTFWLNVEVPGLAVQFPNAPRDLFMAAGHYGQVLIMLPTQDLIIARTGHDPEYWSRLDRLITAALRCFGEVPPP